MKKNKPLVGVQSQVHHVNLNFVPKLGKYLLIKTGESARGIRVGDWINFASVYYHFEVKSIESFASINEVMKEYNGSAFIGDLSSPQNRDDLGVYVFEIEKISNRMVNLSDLILQDDSHFAEILANTYIATGLSNDYYPDHKSWYWTKFVPGVFAGERDGIVAIVNGLFAGVALIKKVDEKKLCNFTIAPTFRHSTLVSMILDTALYELEDDKPLFTISEDRLSVFEPIIKQYGWRQTKTLGCDYYNGRARELVFN